MGFSFDVLHRFPLTRSTWSVALQSYPAKHDPKLTQGGGGVGERNKYRITPKVPARGRNKACRKRSFSLSPESTSFFSLSVAACSLQIYEACMNMQPNIWLMPLLHDAEGWGQQTANPAFLTSGRGELERRWIEERSGKEGSEEYGNERGERQECRAREVEGY